MADNVASLKQVKYLPNYSLVQSPLSRGRSVYSMGVDLAKIRCEDIHIEPIFQTVIYMDGQMESIKRRQY